MPTARPGSPRAPRPSTCSRSRPRAADPGATRRATGPQRRAAARPPRPGRCSVARTSWPSRRSGRLSQRQHRAVPEDALELVATKHEPRPARPLLAARLDPPAPGHPQMAPHDDAAFEPEQEMLADSFDRLEHPPVDAFCDTGRLAAWFGDSTSSRCPTSGCRRRAARWRESPSGASVQLRSGLAASASGDARVRGLAHVHRGIRSGEEAGSVAGVDRIDRDPEARRGPQLDRVDPNGIESRVRIRSTTVWASFGASWTGRSASRITNSSPPTRATTSVSRAPCRMQPATSTSNRSP